MYTRFIKRITIVLCGAFLFYSNVTEAHQHRDKISNIYLFNEFFTGRESILSEIEKRFSKKESYLVLTGAPGVGKSQIAKKYIEKTFHKNKLIWWIDASKNIDDQFKTLALQWNEKLGLQYGKIPTEGKTSEEVVSQTLSLLRDIRINWLLVFDNAVNYSLVQKYLVSNQSGKNGCIILTSKNSLGWTKSINVKPFSQDESIKFLEKALPKHAKSQAERLSLLLHNYPLALKDSKQMNGEKSQKKNMMLLPLPFLMNGPIIAVP